MHYEELMTAINQLDFFDLYRLSLLIAHELDNPARIREIRKHLRRGELISYFSTNKKRLEEAIVVKKNPKYVVVENTSDHEKWSVQYCTLNLKNVAFDLTKLSPNKLVQDDLKVGEVVGFNNDGTQIVGAIMRLNAKTATIITKDQQCWRVSYNLIFKIIDADQ